MCVRMSGTGIGVVLAGVSRYLLMNTCRLRISPLYSTWRKYCPFFIEEVSILFDLSFVVERNNSVPLLSRRTISNDENEDELNSVSSI